MLGRLKRDQGDKRAEGAGRDGDRTLDLREGARGGSTTATAQREGPKARGGTDRAGEEQRAATGAPDPEDERKPDGPTEISKPTWKFVLKRTAAEFTDDECTDLAAALTYYAVLALFPALLVVMALIGLVGQTEQTVSTITGIIEQVAPGDAAATIEGPLRSIADSGAAGAALGIGILGALWSASGYTAAFSRASNRIYEVEEGRPFYKLRPMQLLITAVALLGVAAIAVGLVVSGPLAQAVGDAIGLGSAAVTAWQIAKWPVIIILAALIIAMLYWSTPNVQQPKFRWFSAGSLIALLVWIVASVAFGFYVANFGNYDATYGALGGVIVFLLWLWITNIAILFGAEFDAEMERGRQLQAGLPAEEQIQLPPRDTKKIDKKAEKDAEAVAEAKRLRTDASLHQ